MNRILLAAFAAISFAGIASAQQAPAFPSDHQSNYLNQPSSGRPDVDQRSNVDATVAIDRTTTGSIRQDSTPRVDTQVKPSDRF